MKIQNLEYKLKFVEDAWDSGVPFSVSFQEHEVRIAKGLKSIDLLEATFAAYVYVWFANLGKNPEDYYEESTIRAIFNTFREFIQTYNEERVFIQGRWLNIEKVDEGILDNYQGKVFSDEKLICLSSALSGVEKKAVVFHECLHAAAFYCGIDLEEEDIRIIEQAFVDWHENFLKEYEKGCLKVS